LLLLSQVSYVWHFFSRNTTLVTAAANVASHFILNNLFVFAFIMLWVRDYFWPAEIILIAQVLSLSTAYWTHLGSPPFVHLPVLAGPFAWAITALFWNGAVAVHAHNLPSRIVANVFIWVIFVIGHTHIFGAKDYIFGYCLSLLTLCEYSRRGWIDTQLTGVGISLGRGTVRHQGHRSAVDLRLRDLRCPVRRVPVRLGRGLLRSESLAQACRSSGVHGPRARAFAQQPLVLGCPHPQHLYRKTRIVEVSNCSQYRLLGTYRTAHA
jgi:hypothetical protein